MTRPRTYPILAAMLMVCALTLRAQLALPDPVEEVIAVAEVRSDPGQRWALPCTQRSTRWARSFELEEFLVFGLLRAHERSLP